MSIFSFFSNPLNQKKKGTRSKLSEPAPVKKNPDVPTPTPLPVDQSMLLNDVPAVSYEPKSAGEPPAVPQKPSVYSQRVEQMQKELDAVKRPSLTQRLLRGAMMGSRGGLFGAIGGAVGGGFDPNHRFEQIDRARIQENYDPLLQSDLRLESINDKREDNQRQTQRDALYRRSIESEISNRAADNKRAEEAAEFRRQAADDAKYQRIGDDRGQYLINLRDPKAPAQKIEGVGPARQTLLMSPTAAGEAAQSDFEGSAAPFDGNAVMTAEIDGIAKSTFARLYAKDPDRARAMVQRDPSLMSVVKTKVANAQATHNEQVKRGSSKAKAGAMRGAARGSNQNVGTDSDYQQALQKFRQR